MNEGAKNPILLSPPDVGADEREALVRAFDSGWIAPLGPEVDAFEQEFAARIGVSAAAALNSGTAGLHLALLKCGVGPEDEVLVSDLTFAASVFPIRYLSAKPVFVDSEDRSWNIDPDRLAEAVEDRIRRGRSPRAIIVVHLYGQVADMDRIMEIATRYGIPVIEDAAEALGATYGGRAAGTFGAFGVFSFNGNKIITTSGGGMLVSEDTEAVADVRKLASQAREPVPHYEHASIGFNYRLSNLLASVGRAQLQRLDGKILKRREHFEYYRSTLDDLPGVRFMPESGRGIHTRWLTTLTIDPEEFGATKEDVRLALDQANIEARPVWKPMHLQQIFRLFPVYGGTVSRRLFEQGLCLPSGSGLRTAERERVVAAFRGCCGRL